MTLSDEVWATEADLKNLEAEIKKADLSGKLREWAKQYDDVWGGPISALTREVEAYETKVNAALKELEREVRALK